MSEFRPSNDASLLDDAARRDGIRDRMLMGFVLFTLVRASGCLAGEQPPITNATLDSAPVLGGLHLSPLSATPSTPTAGFFTEPALDSAPVFSATEFRPRKHTVLDTDAIVNSFGNAQMLRTTTVWQRLAEYKSRDRVRLLTLWESSGSTVSIQASNHGDPSLQWSSRVMNRGGSTHGLLDRLFSVSFAGATAGHHNAARSTSAASAPKPANNPMAIGLK